ncbi:HEAT repeat protein [Aquisphaera giovannonii]|uniref:HEAT repeat protein n=1 Tax=Aquisphaera giovannonii TaxID=406548 RepID=A0A5B9VX69_9BACT|nr:HEAT repeat domain-containing protein [Aquisphaera giovannonii]QEH32547.1 HEAT repeat protein [Aquisphaera giovannonii]
MRLRHVARRWLPGVVALAAVLGVASRIFDDWSRGGPCRPLVEALRDGDAEARQDAVADLFTLTLNGVDMSPAIPALVECLDDRDGTVGEVAADALAQVGTKAAPAVPAAARLLRGGRADLRPRLLRILAAVHVREADEILEGALDDPDARRRVEAFEALDFARRADLVPAVIRRLAADPAPAARLAALRMLAATEPHSDRVVEAECLALRDTVPEVRLAGVSLLGTQGRGSTAATEALLASIRDADPRVRAASLNALGQIGFNDERILPELFDAMRDSRIREEARDAIQKLAGRPSSGLAPPTGSLRAATATLRNALGSTDPRTRGAAASMILLRMDDSRRVYEPGLEALADMLPLVGSKVKAQDAAVRRPALLFLLRAVPSEEVLRFFLDAIVDAAAAPVAEPPSPAAREAWHSALTALIGRARSGDEPLRGGPLTWFLPDDLLLWFLPEIVAAMEDEAEEDLRFEAILVVGSLLEPRRALFPPGGDAWRSLRDGLTKQLREDRREIKDMVLQCLEQLDGKAEPPSPLLP